MSRREYHRAYYWANREHILEVKRRWRRSHPMAVYISKAKYKKKNPELYARFVREHNRRNPKKVKARWLLRGHPDRYPLDDTCAFCGKTEKLEHGHIDYDYPELYLTVCHQCNWYMGQSVQEI